jgi:hypothetical protein
MRNQGGGSAATHVRFSVAPHIETVTKLYARTQFIASRLSGWRRTRSARHAASAEG